MNVCSVQRREYFSDDLVNIPEDISLLVLYLPPGKMSTCR